MRITPERLAELEEKRGSVKYLADHDGSPWGATLREVLIGLDDAIADRALLMRVVEAARELLQANQTDFCCSLTEMGEHRSPDDEPVAAGTGGDSAITFGHIRRLATTLAALKG